MGSLDRKMKALKLRKRKSLTQLRIMAFCIVYYTYRSVRQFFPVGSLVGIETYNVR